MAKKHANKRDSTILGNFVAKARHLMTLRYTEQLNQPVSVTLKWKDNIAETSREGPDEESLQALLLTLRLFCQDNEDISLRNMAARIESLPVATDLKRAFLDRRKSLNKYLDSAHGPPRFQIGSNAFISNRQIFDAFTYGKYAHLTQAATVVGWEKLIMHDGLRAAYDMVLRRMLQHIVSMAKYVEDIREALSK